MVGMVVEDVEGRLAKATVVDMVDGVEMKRLKMMVVM